MAGPTDEDDRTLTEETPLLTGSTVSDAETETEAEREVEEEDPRDLVRTRVIVLCVTIIFLIELCVGLCTPAFNALLEVNICREMNPGIAEDLMSLMNNELCKAPAVQGQLAMIRGWSGTLDCVPGLLFSVPFGVMSDKVGRKPILFLSFFGVLLSIAWMMLSLAAGWPTWVCLLESAFQIIGGSAVTGTSMLYTMLADVVHVDAMASVLFRFGSTFLVAELIATPLSGFLLSFSPWWPPVLGLLMGVVCLLAVIIAPETLQVRQWHDARSGRGRAVPEEQSGEEADDDLSGAKTKKTAGGGFMHLVRSNAADLSHFVLGNRRLVVLMLPLIFVTLGRFVQELLLQYSTKRYHWSWSTAAYVITLKTLSLIALFVIVLPAISKFCLDVLKMTPLAKDLWLSRWSGIILISGAGLLALAFTPSIFVFGLITLSAGSGFPVLIRSLLNALVEPHHVGILNTLIGFLEVAGLMVASPTLAAAMRGGLNLGGAWVGLPFMVSGLLFVVASAIVFAFRLPPPEVQRELAD